MNVPPPPHHLLASEQLDSLADGAAAPSARQVDKSLPAHAQLGPAADAQQHADRNSRQPRTMSADAQWRAAQPSDGGPRPHQYSRAASAAASLLTAGRSAASALPDEQQAFSSPAAGAAAPTGYQPQPAAVAAPAAGAGSSVKPGRASPSGTPQVDVVPESPEVGSEEGSPFALAKVLAPALLASAEPALGDAVPTATSFQQAGKYTGAMHGIQPPTTADGALPPALRTASGMAAAGGATGTRAALSAETTPQAKRAHVRPAPTASRLSRGSGVHRSPPTEAVVVAGVAAAPETAVAAMDHDGPAAQGVWHLRRDAAGLAEWDAAAPPAAQTPPACAEAPGPVPAPGMIQSSGAQRPLPAGTDIAEAAASLTLRLSEPDERGTPVLAGAAAKQGLQSAAAPATLGAQIMPGLHTQAPSAPHSTLCAAAGAEYTPEPAARLGLTPMVQPPLSGDPNPIPDPGRHPTLNSDSTLSSTSP